MITEIDVVQNDKLYRIYFTLHDANDNAIDLTTGTPVLKAQLQTGTALSVSGNMSIGTATTGECYYTVQANDFASAGDYYAEVEVTYASGQIITIPDIIIRVKPELPRSF